MFQPRPAPYCCICQRIVSQTADCGICARPICADDMTHDGLCMPCTQRERAHAALVRRLTDGGSLEVE